MTLPSRGAWTSVSGCYYQLEQMLHFTSLGLKEKHWSCTGTKPCVCLCPSGLHGGAGEQAGIHGLSAVSPCLAQRWDQL